MHVFVWVFEYLPDNMSLAVCGRGCVHVLYFSMFLLWVCIFACCVFLCPPREDWLDKTLPVRPCPLYMAASLWLSDVSLFKRNNISTVMLASRRDPRMMKLCALPNCKAFFIPWYPLSFLLPLAFLLQAAEDWLSATDWVILGQSVISTSSPQISPLLLMSSIKARLPKRAREKGKLWKVSKEWPTKELHLYVGTAFTHGLRIHRLLM